MQSMTRDTFKTCKVWHVKSEQKALHVLTEVRRKGGMEEKMKGGKEERRKGGKSIVHSGCRPDRLLPVGVQSVTLGRVMHLWGLWARIVKTSTSVAGVVTFVLPHIGDTCQVSERLESHRFVSMRVSRHACLTWQSFLRFLPRGIRASHIHLAPWRWRLLCR